MSRAQARRRVEGNAGAPAKEEAARQQSSNGGTQAGPTGTGIEGHLPQATQADAGGLSCIARVTQPGQGDESRQNLPPATLLGYELQLFNLRALSLLHQRRQIACQNYTARAIKCNEFITCRTINVRRNLIHAGGFVVCLHHCGLAPGCRIPEPLSSLLDRQTPTILKGEGCTRRNKNYAHRFSCMC